MKTSGVLSLCSAFASFSAVNAVSATPVTKVIEMLQEMHTKGEASKQEEITLHDQISETVHKQLLDLSLNIGGAKKTIKSEEATHLSETANADKLDDETEEKESELGTFQKELGDQKKIRNEENAEFVTEEADLSAAVDALRRAVDTLKTQTPSTAMDSSFVQHLASTIPRAKPELDAFLEQEPPQATEYAYEFQSGTILKLLKDLEDKFTTALQKAQTEEANKAHSFALYKLDVDSEIENLENAIAKLKTDSSKSRTVAAGAMKAMKAAKQRLADLLEDESSTKAYKENQDLSFEQNQKVRTEELEALGQAIEILSGDAVSASAAKHLPTLLQKATSFLQLGSKFESKTDSSLSESDKKNIMERASKIIDSRNRIVFENKSEALSLVSTQMLTGGHFDKVVKLVEDLIGRLESEAASEKQHHEWCETEMKDNEFSRETYQGQVDTLLAKVESLEAHISKLSTSIKEFNEEAATLKDDMAVADKTRRVQKEKNLATIQDAQGAREALGQATKILSTFYADHASLLQQQPQIEAYRGQQNKKQGVLGMLEVIESDFARLEADTKAAESSAEAAHETYMKESTVARDDAIAAEQAAKVEKIQKEATTRRTKAELENSRTMLSAAVDYFQALKPQCVVQQVSPEERIQMRDEEIAALKEALDVLENHPDFTH